MATKMSDECGGVERIIIRISRPTGGWVGIVREAYERDRTVTFRSGRAARAWLAETHDGPCECGEEG